jgi:hypothetical protein
MLAYTDTDVDAPDTWIESDTKLIHNTQMVKLHSFDTKVCLGSVPIYLFGISITDLVLDSIANSQFLYWSGRSTRSTRWCRTRRMRTTPLRRQAQVLTMNQSTLKRKPLLLTILICFLIAIAVIREARIELLEAKLGRFVMLANESAEEMYTRLKKIIKKIRSYGSKKWTDHEVVKIMLRAYFLRNSVLCFMIRDSPNYEKMTPEVVLGRFIRHETLLEEAKYVDIMSKSVTASKNQDIALNANKKQKGKCVFEESTSEDNEDSSSLDEEKIALIKSFKKIMKSRNYKSNKKNDKE